MSYQLYLLILNLIFVNYALLNTFDSTVIDFHTESCKAILP